MIEHAEGNLLQADMEALVNTVNCVGYMGKGIALQFKQAFPENFTAYQAACRADEVVPGRMFIFDNARLINPLYIISFPTKRHWQGKSRITDIESGLKALIEEVRRLGVLANSRCSSPNIFGWPGISFVTKDGCVDDQNNGIGELDQ